MYIVKNVNFTILQNSVSDLVDEMPQAGQMLGRLASLPFILANAGCSTALVKCLSYYIFSASKQSPLEVHAEQWALVNPYFFTKLYSYPYPAEL